MKYIHKYNERDTFSTQERCSINELFNIPDDKECSIAKASVETGISTQLHAVKKTVERYVIIDGEGEVQINHQEPVKVSALDIVIIPQGQPQKITNTGTKTLIFLCICTPRFKQENYIKLEADE